MGATTVGRVSQCPQWGRAPVEPPSARRNERPQSLVGQGFQNESAASAPRKALLRKGFVRLCSRAPTGLMSKLCFRYVFANNPLLCDPHNLSPQDITETLETERAPTPKGRGSDRWVGRGLRGRSAGLPLPATLPTRPPWCPPSRRP